MRASAIVYRYLALVWNPADERSRLEVLSLVARLSSDVRDADLACKAQAAGFAVDALSSRVIRYRQEGGLLLGFTKEQDPDTTKRVKDPEAYLRSILGRTK